MKKLLLLLAAALAAFLVSGCSSIDQKVRSMPAFNFKSWSHSDRYGLFTDAVIISGVSWTYNADGSATARVGHYDGQAAWAGTVGPHDVIEELEIVFGPTTPQAQALRLGVRPAITDSILQEKFKDGSAYILTNTQPAAK